MDQHVFTLKGRFWCLGGLSVHRALLRPADYLQDPRPTLGEMTKAFFNLMHLKLGRLELPIQKGGHGEIWIFYPNGSGFKIEFREGKLCLIRFGKFSDDSLDVKYHENILAKIPIGSLPPEAIKQDFVLDNGMILNHDSISQLGTVFTGLAA